MTMLRLTEEERVELWNRRTLCNRVHDLVRHSIASVCLHDLESYEKSVERAVLRKVARELDKWWGFDHHQVHSHTWHDKQDFLEMLRAAASENP